MRSSRLFVRFTKIDEEKREVAGRLTQEIVDRDGEIWDYDASVPHFKAWSSDFEKATDGKSLGNLRAMHQNISAGKLTAIDFNEADKAIDIVAKVVDDAEWEKTKEGVYTGFSVGGNVVRSWRDAGDRTHKRFEVTPSEASLADYPCVPTATFQYIKTGGIVEQRKFKKTAEPRADAAPRYADEANARFPLYNKTVVRVALARWAKTETRALYAEPEQSLIGRKIRAAAREHGFEVSEKAMLRGDFNKGLYEVGRLAEAIESLSWMQRSARYEAENENDGSTVPSQLCDNIADLLDTLETMLGEESDELLRVLGYTDPDDTLVEAAASAPSTKTATPSGAPMADNQNGADFTKAMSKKNFEKLSSIHESAKAAHTVVGDMVTKLDGNKHHAFAKVAHEVLGTHCEKLSGFLKDMGEPADDDSTEKIAPAEFQKVKGEAESWQKRHDAVAAELAAAETQIDELMKAGEEVSKALEVRKGKLQVVSKETDGQAALGTATATPPAAAVTTKVAKPGEVDRPALHTSFKTAFTKGRLEGAPAE